MSDGEASLWDAPMRPGADSIAEQLASRIDAAAASPADEVGWAALAADAEREAAARGSGAAAAALLHEAARIHEDRLGAPDAALAALERAAAADPTFAPALQVGRRLAVTLGRSAMAAAFCALEEPLAPNSQARAALALQASRLLTASGQPDEALAALERAAAADPGAFAVAEEQAIRAAAAGDRRALAEAWERCAATCGDPRLEADFLVAAAGLLEDALGDLARAGDLALRAFELHGADPVVRAAARRHAEREPRREVLATILRLDAEVAGAEDAPLAWLELARVLGELSRRDEQLEALEAGRQIAPSDPLLLAELARLREASGDWPAVAATLRELAGAHLDRDDPAHLQEAVDAWVRLAEVEEEQLRRPVEASACYRAVLALAPGHRAALSALGRLCARAGDWEGLLETFTEEAATSRDPREVAQKTYKAAEVADERLDDRPRAVELYAEALRLDPGLVAARSALERLHERDGRWSALLALVETDLAELDASPAKAARTLQLTLLQRRAEIMEEHLDEPDRARLAWQEVLGFEPSYPPALRALGQLHARAGQWEALIGLFRTEADAAPDAAGAAEHVLRIAAILDRRLDSADEAIAAYREVLTLAPTHMTALGALGRRYRARGDHEALVELLRGEAVARAAPRERAAVLTEVGRLCETQLHDMAQAAESYQEALRASPGFVPAARALDRLYAALGSWRELAELRLDEATWGGDRTSVLLGLARLALDRDGDPAAARRFAGEATEAAPGHPAPLLLDLRLDAGVPERRGALRAALADAAAPGAAIALLEAAAADLPRRSDLLERALDLGPASAALVPLLDRRILTGPAEAAARHAELRAREAGTDQRQAVASWETVAAERWTEAGQPARAEQALGRALAAVPDHHPALRASRAAALGREDLATARSLARREAVARRDPRGGASLHLEAGALGERLGDVEGAAQDFRLAAELDPLDPTPLARLEALLPAGGGLDVLAAREARARAERDPARAADAWLAVARSALASGEAPSLAAGALDRALEARPGAAAVLELRARLRAAGGQFADALDDYELALAEGGEPALRLPLHLAAAALCQDQLGVVPRARAHLEAALTLQPESVEALTRLAGIDEAAGRTAQAIETLRRLLALPGHAPAVAAGHHATLGRLEARAGDPARAMAHSSRALELEPGHAEALRLQVDLERGRGDPRTLATVLEAAADLATDPSLRAELRVESARLHAGPLRQRVRAVEQLRAALLDDPGRDDARVLLASAYEESAPALAVEEHRRLLEGEPLRAESWLALYRLFERLRAHDRAYVAATVLRWLGEPSPGPVADRLLAEGDRQALTAPPALGDDELALLRPPADQGALSELFVIAGDALADALRGGPPAGEPARGDHPLRRPFAELARAVGADDAWELYPAAPGALEVELGAKPAVRCGIDLARRTSPREQRFLLGRIAIRLRTRSALATGRDDTQLGEAVAAAVRQVVLGWSGTGRPAEELVKSLGRLLGRRARKALEPVVRALVAGPPPDLAAWREAAAATADRAGLVLCGDVPTAVRVLASDRLGTTLDGPELVAAVWEHPQALALLAFAASEAHFTLRQKLRVAIA